METPRTALEPDECEPPPGLDEALDKELTFWGASPVLEGPAVVVKGVDRRVSELAGA